MGEKATLQAMLSALSLGMGAFLALFGHRYPHTTEFVTGASVFGVFCWAHLLPYFDGSLLVFYVFGIVVVLVGGLVGGVFGVLLPKVALGSALGVLVALFITSIEAALSLESSSGQLVVSSVIFVGCIAAALFMATKIEPLVRLACTSLVASWLLVAGLDLQLKQGFASAMGVILRMADPSKICYSDCHVPLLVIVWAIATLAILVLQGNLQGVLKHLRLSEQFSYQRARTEAPTPKVPSQRTFSYPDNAEHNYFDTDNLPPSMQASIDIVFQIANSLATEFGFQVDSVRNQIEHTLVLLANTMHGDPNDPSVRQRGIHQLHSRLFENYKSWCTRLGTTPCFSGRLPVSSQSSSFGCITSDATFRSETTDVMLFLLIWGEAANLRHMPESLCFLFHKMMQDHVQHVGTQREVNYPGFFLDNVITPIFDVVSGAQKQPEDHERRRNYDDFNEFFWSPKCLSYHYLDETDGYDSQPWPEHGSQRVMPHEGVPVYHGLANARKTYLEKRSWLHPLYAFHRIVEWHIVAFQILATFAFSRHLLWDLLYALKIGSSVFWTLNFLGIVWICLEVWVMFPNTNLSSTAVCGYLIRLMARYLLLVYQTLYFVWGLSSNTPNPGTLQAEGDADFWWWQFVWLSLIGLSVHFVDAACQLFPKVSTLFYSSTNTLLQSFLNICFPFSRLYVGKKVDVPFHQSWLYTLYWLSMIALKLWFSYTFEIAPMVLPTVLLFDDFMNYPGGSLIETSALIIARWLPQFLVFCLDFAIFYSVWSALVGAFVGLYDRLGAVRDFKTLRQHFIATPDALCSSVIWQGAISRYTSSDNVAQATTDDRAPLLASPTAADAKSQTKKKLYGSKSVADLSYYQRAPEASSAHVPDISEVEAPMDVAALRNYVGRFLDVRTQKWVIFARVWNEVVDHMRQSDIISNAERDTLKFDRFDWLSKPVYLPVLQTAGCVERAVHMTVQAAAAFRAESDRTQQLQVLEGWNAELIDDVTVAEAVSETCELFTWLLQQMLGSVHSEDVAAIASTVTSWTSNDAFFARLALDRLPAFQTHATNIVRTLKAQLPKRKPVAVQSTHDAANARLSAPVSSSSGMRKSVSTSFLAALDQQAEMNAKSKNKHRGFEKLQPFRKGEVLHDKTRDAVYESLKLLLSGLRSALRASAGSAGKDMIDRITFMLSMETGFFLDEFYASQQLDQLATDPRVKAVLAKLDGMLSLQQSAAEPIGLEARRRLTFFVNSLYMEVPAAPSLRDMRSVTVMTPFYAEDVLYNRDDLEAQNSDGVSTLLYLLTLYRHDWNNFLERLGLSDDSQIFKPKYLLETRMWASLRAQTLFRTVEGMMYADAALRLLAELEGISAHEAEHTVPQKFNYIVATQVYGRMKKNQESKADDIEFLLQRHPNLRVAYIEEVRMNREGDIAMYSVLIKGDSTTGGTKEIYRVKLPGNPVVGEGKPENQNHSVIFSRGQHVMAVDMNQDGYFEEALKLRNLLEEFRPTPGRETPRIVGFREHIFTGSVSSLANYMALQETSFVTLAHRVLERPLKIRLHYGHPDLFDKMFMMTNGGMSKASRGINLSEDVFAGYSYTLRGGFVRFCEYTQVGKGRDVGMQQIYKFEAKLSQGASEQSISRDVSRLCERLDFFRLFSFYYGGIGHYLTNVMVICALLAVSYVLALLAIFNREEIGGRAVEPSGTLQLILGGLGLLQTLPLFFTLSVEKGFADAAIELAQLFISGGPLYFIFQIQTKSYYYCQTMLAGGAQYRATGRGFVTRHSSFAENYRFFASSHLYLGLELAMALIIFAVYTSADQYAGKTWALWLAAVSFLFAPFWFNPLAFDWNRVTEDYSGWLQWMSERGGSAEHSWEVWWNEEHEYLKHIRMSWRCTLAIIHCGMYVLFGIGLTGPDIFAGKFKDWLKIGEVALLFAGLLIGYYLIEATQRRLSYGIRRTLKVLLSMAFLGVLTFLMVKHITFITHTVAIYYFCGALAYLGKLCGVQGVSVAYWIHDLILGHIIFVALFVLAALQIPSHIQTWLLYHNALSAGVVIEDILRHARKSREEALASTAADQTAELRKLVQNQDVLLKRLLRERGLDENSALLSDGSLDSKSEERTSLLSATGAPSLQLYGATSNATDRASAAAALAASSIKSPTGASVHQGDFLFAQPDRPPPRK